VQTKLGKSKKKASELSPPIPKRARKATKYKGLSAALIAELWQLAAFYSLVDVFTKCEKTKQDVKLRLIAEQYYGNPAKKKKGFCQQLIDGDFAFAALYIVKESDLGVERTLKQSCCGKDTSAMLVAGVDFTVEMLYTFSKNKQYTGRSIWALAMTVLCLLKKAVSLVPKLSPTIVVIDKSCIIILYGSGRIEASFHQYIDNGMYEMLKSEENSGENA
jgi:hypothetical protein